MFAVIFVCWNLFLQNTGKTAKIGTCKNFVPHSYLEIIMLSTLDIFTGPEMRLRFAGYRVLDSVTFLLEHRLGYSCLNGFLKGAPLTF